MTRVLFVPFDAGGMSHLNPLMALERMLDPSAYECAYFLPPRLKGFAPELGIRALPGENHGLHEELSVYRSFAPDVVVDDFSLTTGYASRLKKVPRVAIQRAGSLPHEVPGNPAYMHGTFGTLDRVPDASALGLEPPRALSDLMVGAAKVIPAIPSLELLPEPVRDDPSFFYAGPLLGADRLWGVGGDQSAPFRGTDRDFAPLERFLEQNEGRDVVYVTYGLITNPPPVFMECIEYLLQMGLAVVATAIRADELARRYPGRYFYALYLPMHYVCSRAKVMVHHCGSGVYQYPLLHEIPAITVGTQFYDREDVARRLQERGSSRHLPAPAETDRFTDIVEGVLASGPAPMRPSLP